MKSTTKKVARRRTQRLELIGEVLGKLGALGSVATPAIDKLTPEAEADAVHFLREQLPKLLRQFDIMTHADVLEPRILFYRRREEESGDQWRKVDAHCGHPLLFPEGVESLKAYIDALMPSRRCRLALWHMSLQPNEASPDIHHLIYMRHASGQDMQLVVHDDNILPLPISSDVGRKMVFATFQASHLSNARSTLMRPFVEVPEMVAGRADDLDAALIAQGLQPLGVDDKRLPAIAKWLLSEEHLLPGILPVLRGGARDALAGPVSSLLDVAFQAATEAAEFVKQSREAYETECQETFDKKHRRVNDELARTKILMQGAIDASQRAQLEVRDLKAQLASATQPAAPNPQANLADALNALFD